MSLQINRLGLIAGNGRFPFLVLEEAVRRSIPVTVVAIKEETSPDIEKVFTPEKGVAVHWVGVGHLGKLLRIFKKSGVDKAIMAGQVKHNRIFSREESFSVSRVAATIPDLTMLRLLMSLPRKNTEALIGGVADILARNGIELLDSTCLLQHLLAPSGLLTSRKPTEDEWRNIRYGREVAREIARLDIGQTIVIKDQAVVAVEAMEGTDETIRRAACLAGYRPLTVIKVSRPKQDMRIDVPVLGKQSLEVFRACHVSALALDAGKTLILDRQEFMAEADRMKMTIVAE
ncbi:MAG TPA: UDP-2,3-diacylglucosamine diphosphatase LpxI [Acidobacteriota bacterium]|nr:UDP-2,3-diacylglucosamine diphosphatase LpxI [Acidobacteriota bacterium]